MTFNDIYTEYGKLIFNLALQYVHNVEDAEEITQDVFVKVNEGLSTFRNNSSIKTWIYRITIHQSLDFIKSRKNRKRSFISSFWNHKDKDFKYLHTQFNHPGIELEQKEATEAIFKAINQLSPRQKTVIILLKIEGKSQNESAELMNMSEKALESLFQRAKKNLEKLLNYSKG